MACPDGDKGFAAIQTVSGHTCKSSRHQQDNGLPHRVEWPQSVHRKLTEMATRPVADWVQRLQLQKHVEGGWYSEVYRSALVLQQDSIPEFKGDRSACTHIYFLLEQND